MAGCKDAVGISSTWVGEVAKFNMPSSRFLTVILEDSASLYELCGAYK